MRSYTLEGPSNLRIKLALSLLTAKSLCVKNIRNRSLNPGVTPAEVSLLKLLDSISNGTRVTISDTGTTVTIEPGILTGGVVDHECAGERGIGYYLEFLLVIAPFCKQPLQVNLTGVTNSEFDPSVDMIKAAWLPIYTKCLGPVAASSLKLEIQKRGVHPGGGGQVLFCSKPCACLLPVTHLVPGKVYRIRGVAWSCRVSPNNGHKLMLGAKSILNKVLSDVYITLDHRKGDQAGNSPGFGLTLWAETKQGAVYSSDVISQPEGSNALPVDSEGLGRLAANRLLDQISQGGFIDSGAQSLAMIMMACETGRNASQLAIGAPTSYTVATLRLIQLFLGVTFSFNYHSRTALTNMPIPPNTSDTPVASEKPEEPSSPDYDVLVATCFGAGLQSVGRAIR